MTTSTLLCFLGGCSRLELEKTPTYTVLKIPEDIDVALTVLHSKGPIQMREHPNNV